MTQKNLLLIELPKWHQTIILRLSNASFPGQSEIKQQLMSAKFRFIDKNGSLDILPQDEVKAPVEKTIPVEANAADEDGVLIQVLLFTRRGVAYMLEILREDGEPTISLPSVEKFKIMVLAP